MNDPRSDQRAAVARWLRVRANVRALAARLVAAEHRLQADAQRSSEPEFATLAAQVTAERGAIDTLASELDERIADVRSTFATHERAYTQSLGAQAHSSRRRSAG